MRFLPRLLVIAVALTLVLAPGPLGAVPPQDGQWDSCSTTCWYGNSCSASGPAPCSCQCSGFLGLGGPRCFCGGHQLDCPVGE
jgi:hypothetical protein